MQNRPQEMVHDVVDACGTCMRCIHPFLNAVPLHLAVLNGHENVVEFLLSEGVDWKATNSLGMMSCCLSFCLYLFGKGRQPRDYARKRNMKKLFEDADQV